MNEQENTNLVRKTYELFKSGDIETLLGMYSDDIRGKRQRLKTRRSLEK